MQATPSSWQLLLDAGANDMGGTLINESISTSAGAQFGQLVGGPVGERKRIYVAYFGGTTEAYVCDQLRAGVTTPCRYEPGVQRTYEEWARHHGAVVLPARAVRLDRP